MPLKRRDLSAALAAALVWLARPRRVSGQGIDGQPARWLASLDDAARALAAGEIGGSAWTDRIVEIFASTSLEDVLAQTDFERLAQDLRLPAERPAVRRVRGPGFDESGLVVKVFGLRRGVAIVPHGHQGIASLQLVARGRIRGRHYDRVFAGRGHLVVRPTADLVRRPGDVCASTLERDNVHWFQAESEVAFGISASVRNLPTTGRTGRVYLDPDAAVPRAGGLLRMPIIGTPLAFARYGRRE